MPIQKTILILKATFLDVLEKQAPMKKGNVRANEVPYMTKALRKAIMTRSRLQNRHHKLKTDESKLLFNRQRNYCNRLYKRERRKFYLNLNFKDINDDETFWKYIKPFFSNKGTSKSVITLVEKGKIISDDLDVATTLNSFFENAVNVMDIPKNNDWIINQNDISDPIDAIISKFLDHPSILNINKTINKSVFNFKLSDLDEIKKEVLNLKTNVSVSIMKCIFFPFK